MTFYRFFNLAGDNSKEATPDPIPNSEVKRLAAKIPLGKIAAAAFFVKEKAYFLLNYHSRYDIIFNVVWPPIAYNRYKLVSNPAMVPAVRVLRVLN